MGGSHPAWGMWQLGLSVVPVPSPSRFHDGKVPAIRWKEYQSARPKWPAMHRWFDRGADNYAVVTGRVSGVVVVDVDDSAAYPWVRWNLPRTPWMVKTAKGAHLYYRPPRWTAVGNRARVAGMALDVRGNGGFVIGPGSRHRSGFVYRAVGDWRVPKGQLPRLDPSVFELRKIAAPPPPPHRPVSDLAERGRLYLARIPRPVIGQGSDNATFGAACRLTRGFGLPAPIALALLRRWAPDFDPAWLARKVESAAKHGSEITRGLV